MIFQSSQTCPNCSSREPKDVKFCSQCGEALAGGSVKCGVCGTENRGDAKFCTNCRQALEVSAAPIIYNHHWARYESDFAVRVEADDLPGLLDKGLKVEPGTNAMLIERGVNKGIVPPGEYTISNLGWRLRDWFMGDIPERLTVLLVDVTPAEFTFNLGGRFTKDPLPIGMSVRMQVEVVDPGKFLVNVLKGNERLSREYIREYLYPQVVQVADRWLRNHTLQELVEDPLQTHKFELALEEEMRTTFAQSGLRFLQVRTVELNLEPYDHLKKKKSSFSLRTSEVEIDAEGNVQLFDAETGGEISMQEAKLRADKRFADLEHEANLFELEKVTKAVQIEEQRVDVNQRMRAAVMSDRMNDVRSTADFEVFMDEIDHDKLLREKERTDLVRTWKEESEDHNRARAHTAAMLEVEQNYDLRMAELKYRGEIDIARLDVDINISRKRADYEFEIKRRTAEEELRLEQERHSAALARQENQWKSDRLQQQQELADDVEAAKIGLELLAIMKANKRLDEEERLRIIREDELKRVEFNLDIELKKMEAIERERQAEREHELRKMETLGTLSVEALISVSGSEQALILGDLKKTEIFSGMTEEQILAAAAKDSPEVAHAFAIKFQAITDGEASQREREMYERLLGERKDMLQEVQEQHERRASELKEAWEGSMQRIQDISESGMKYTSETARAFAEGQTGPTVVVVPDHHGSHVVHGPGAGARGHPPEGKKVCPTCGNFVSIDVKYCHFCGNKFEGV